MVKNPDTSVALNLWKWAYQIKGTDLEKQTKVLKLPQYQPKIANQKQFLHKIIIHFLMKKAYYFTQVQNKMYLSSLLPVWQSQSLHVLSAEPVSTFVVSPYYNQGQ